MLPCVCLPFSSACLTFLLCFAWLTCALPTCPFFFFVVPSLVLPPPRLPHNFLCLSPLLPSPFLPFIHSPFPLLPPLPPSYHPYTVSSTPFHSHHRALILHAPCLPARPSSPPQCLAIVEFPSFTLRLPLPTGYLTFSPSSCPMPTYCL